MHIYCVIHQDKFKEYTTYLIAENKLRASESVEGAVMDVSDSIEIKNGQKICSSGWSKSFSESYMRAPTERWQNYLKSLNLNDGIEDKAV